MSNKSVESYLGQITSGKRVSDKARIVDKIKKREKDTLYKEPFNTSGLQFHLGLKNQTFTARLSELNDEGIIELKDSGGDWSTVHLVPKERQQEVIDLRSRERLDRVKKIAGEYGYFLVNLYNEKDPNAKKLAKKLAEKLQKRVQFVKKV